MRIALEEVTAALADRFRVEREIGSGGWAVVHLAEDLKLGRKVAIKVLRPELATADGEQRFEREIRVAANLTHPHLLPLLDSGIADGFSYYVMPYIEGESLREKLEREGQLTIREAMRIGREIADALSYAHARGVIHRDIKPGNIMLEAGHAVVTDFGIAALTQRLNADSLTKTGEAPGTIHYMAPEQADGESEPDGRADIYSLGCVLYEMLAGDPPIPGSRAQVVLARKLVGEIPRLRVVREAVPEVLERVILRALERVPADRFQKISELGEALGSIRVEVPTTAEEHLSRRRTPMEKLSLAVGAVLVGLAGTLIIGFLTTTAFDIKLQMPQAFTPSRSDHLIVGARALLPFFVFSLAAMGVVRALRQVMRRAGNTLTRVPILGGPSRAVDKYLTRGNRVLGSARSSTLADLFFVGLIAVSLIVLSRFDHLLSILWSTETEILSCAHKPLHRAYMLNMVFLITGFGSAWFTVFPWLARRALPRTRMAVPRWGSLAWLGGLLILLTLPWRIMNDEAERLEVDGQRAYLLDQTETELLIFRPERGFAEVRERGQEARIRRLGLKGPLFEGSLAFASGIPGCDSVTQPQQRRGP